MRSRTIAMFLGSALSIAACTGSEQATSTKELPSAETTEPPVAAPDNDAPDSEQEAASEPELRSGLMVSLLATLPLAAYDAALESGAGVIEIELVDFNAASSAAGFDRPDPGDHEASIDWLINLTRGEPAANGGSGFAITSPRFPDLNSVTRPDEVEAELGFTIFDLDRSAVFTASPIMVAVASGNGLELSPTLVDLGGGVLSAGEGEDFQVSLEATTPARPLGRPLRLASSDGVVAASLSTPVIESWLSGEPSLREAAHFLAAGEALDAAGAVGGYVVESSFPPSPDPEAEPLGFSQRFSVLGIGATTVEGRAANAMVYVFDDEASAATALPELDTAWRTGVLARGGQPIAELFELVSVEQLGRAVLITANVSEQSSTLRAVNMLFSGEPIFANG